MRLAAEMATDIALKAWDFHIPKLLNSATSGQANLQKDELNGSSSITAGQANLQKDELDGSSSITAICDARSLHRMSSRLFLYRRHL